MPLDEYRRKRDFSRTPEPGGAAPAAGGPGFVVQKHAARQLHYDLRLEHGGTLLSWAVPKGPSLDPADKRLAVRVEDHPLEYADFEGVIPSGEYGGGTVMVWDRGTWEPLGDTETMLAKGDLEFRLHGTKLSGDWVLARMERRASGSRDNWLLIKHRDDDARPRGEHDVLSEDASALSGGSMELIGSDADATWRSEPAAAPATGGARGEAAPFPADAAFALATHADRAPGGDAWLHEIKIDGYRAMLLLSDGEARFLTRSGQDWTARFTRQAEAARALGAHEAVIDGEIAIVAPDGTTSFGALQRAISDGRGALTYFAFDLLHLDGRDLRGLPVEERKAALAELLGTTPPGAPIRYLGHIAGDGPAFHASACALALEGSVSKRLGSRYRARRTADWVKVKCSEGDEFVIGGWTDPRGSRIGFGALLLGAYDAPAGLRYVGRVGTGFSAAALRDIASRLAPLATTEPAFTDPPDGLGAHWVRPELVAEVSFAEWTSAGLLRQPVFLAIREDKPGAEVVRDRASAAAPALTNPDRVLWPEMGLTKRDLASYWEAVAERALPLIGGRPLTLVRCPIGHDEGCFYQKHVEETFPDTVGRVEIPTREGPKEWAYVEDVAGLLGLVQMGVLEVHPWASRVTDVELPDLLAIDLDPGPGVDWERVRRAAVTVRDTLARVGLTGFVKSTGGKGLHVLAPIAPERGWEEVRAFARSLAEAMADARPAEYTARIAKAEREGRILVDYVRNAREATAVGAYSPRARAGAPVSTPLTWEELDGLADAAGLDVAAVGARSAGPDPWSGWEAARARLPDAR